MNARTLESLRQLNIAASLVERSECQEICRDWLHRFCPHVKKETGDWIFGGYRWHAYSFHHEIALAGEKALKAYRDRPLQPFYVYFEMEDLLFNCVSGSWPDFIPLETDLYVFPRHLGWTFITTHEMSMNLGPYFAEPPLNPSPD